MLEIKNLSVCLDGGEQNLIILRDISFSLEKGEILGIAGESGSGKTILSKTILNLINKPVVKSSGSILLDGSELITEEDFRKIRGKKISMIFQNPTSSLNPVFTIGDQITEAILAHEKMPKKQAWEKAVSLLSEVEIPHPDERMKAYPHQLSGGMNQRVMIAMALSSDPEILIADEPTTALDVTIQQQIIRLIKKLNAEKQLSVLFITHDIDLLSGVSDSNYIMYAGEMMEKISSSDLKNGLIRHPYTKALKNCVPEIGDSREYLNTIKGTIAFNSDKFDNRCVFAERCERKTERCEIEKSAFKDGFRCHNPY